MKDEISCRRAYVGLSSPILFDYGTSAIRTFNDVYSSPNPILENPYALFLLYDEIWFLCESLCPQNMRHLGYVKFIDKDIELRRKISHIKRDISFSIPKYQYEPNDYMGFIKSLPDNYCSTLDFHTHELRMYGDKFYAKPEYGNYFFDILVINELSEYQLEMVTNSFVGKFISEYEKASDISNVNQYKLVEKLVIRDIPNYRSNLGPYHECVEEMRNDSFLVDFRKWIIEENSNIKESELIDIVKGVNNAIKQDSKLLYDNVGSNKIYLSWLYTGIIFTIDTTATVLTGLPIPPATIFKTFYDSYVEMKIQSSKKESRYRGFIVNSRNAYYT